MNPHHMDFVKKGRSSWNAWRLAYPDIQPDLSHADLQKLELDGFNFQQTNFSFAHLNQSSIFDSQFNYANLTHADLRQVRGKGAHFDFANLDYAQLDDAELPETSFIHTQLSYASLTGTDAENANFSQANLPDAILSGANFKNSNLSSAHLQNALLMGTNLSHSLLHNADLAGAYLGLTIFYATQFRETSCHSATMAWTHLDEIDLQGLQGLETIIHMGPSRLNINTVYCSKGNIPEAFLQGCGVPQSYINFLQSQSSPLLLDPRCFICFYKEDQAFAKKLQTSLRQNGVRCWLNLLAPDLESTQEAVYAASFLHFFSLNYLSIFDQLILILSEHANDESEINSIITMALEKEKESQKASLYTITITEPSENHYMDRIRTEAIEPIIWNFSDHKDAVNYQNLVSRMSTKLMGSVI